MTAERQYQVGESLKMAAAILGHSTAAATEVYAHLQHDSGKIANPHANNEAAKEP